MNDVLNTRLEVLTAYYAEIDAAIGVQMRIIETYRGMLATSTAVQAAHLRLGIERATIELRALFEDRAQVDILWNEALLKAERGD